MNNETEIKRDILDELSKYSASKTAKNVTVQPLENIQEEKDKKSGDD